MPSTSSQSIDLNQITPVVKKINRNSFLNNNKNKLLRNGSKRTINEKKDDVLSLEIEYKKLLLYAKKTQFQLPATIRLDKFQYSNEFFNEMLNSNLTNDENFLMLNIKIILNTEMKVIIVRNCKNFILI